MRWRAASIAVVISVGACGGDGGAGDTVAGGQSPTTMDMAGEGQHTDHVGNPTSTCSPSGPALSITANGTKFDKDCLAAPASQAFTINYNNQDALSHNIAILESHTASDVLFRAEIFQGPAAQVFNVGALRPGVYAFHCEVHPARMSGTFIVK